MSTIEHLLRNEGFVKVGEVGVSDDGSIRVPKEYAGHGELRLVNFQYLTGGLPGGDLYLIYVRKLRIDDRDGGIVRIDSPI